MTRFETVLKNQSFPLLDFMAQSLNKCSDEKLKEVLKERFRKRLNDCV